MRYEVRHMLSQGILDESTIAFGLSFAFHRHPFPPCLCQLNKLTTYIYAQAIFLLSSYLIITQSLGHYCPMSPPQQ